MKRIGLVLAACLGSAGAARLEAFGARGHWEVSRAAVRAVPDDGPAFLRTHEDWIVYLAMIPDSVRGRREPFSKMREEPNHLWLKERVAFLKVVPRSRLEFELAVNAEHRRLVAAGQKEEATYMNLRYTGTLPYAAVENYERMVQGMRRYRAARARKADTRFIEIEVASYFAYVGHYMTDGADTGNVTMDPRMRGGRLENKYPDLIKLRSEDFQHDIPAPTVMPDAFDAILAYLAGVVTPAYVDAIHQLEARDALSNATDQEALALVRRQVARAATMTRDLAYTAWLRSAEDDRMLWPLETMPTHPHYNPETGFAPAEPWPMKDRK